MNRLLKALTKNRKYLPLIIFSLFQSCIATKPAVNNSGSNFYKSYYLDKGVEIFFIKPLMFNSKVNHLLIDFTLQNDRDTCVANFSVIGSTRFEKPDSVIVSNKHKSIKLCNLEKLYAQSIKTKHKIRYTSKLPVTDFLKLQENSDWKIEYYKDSVSELFELKKRGMHKLEKMRPAFRDCFNSDLSRK